MAMGRDMMHRVRGGGAQGEAAPALIWGMRGDMTMHALPGCSASSGVRVDNIHRVDNIRRVRVLQPN